MLTLQCKRPIKYNIGEKENSIKYFNPFTNKPFTDTELKFIKIKAILLSIRLLFNPTMLFQACEEHSKKRELEELCGQNNFDKIKTLLLNENGKIANLMLADRALSDAVNQGKIELVKFLLDLGVPANHPINEKRSFHPPLILAEGKMVKLLLENKAEVNTSIGEKTTPLWCAAFNSNIKKAELFLKAGAKVNGCYDLDGRYSILHAAIMSGNPGMVKFILNAGADTFDKCKAGYDALAYAKVMKQDEITKIILDHNNHLDKSASKIQFWFRRVRDENKALSLIQDKDHSVLAKSIIKRRA